MLLESPGEVVSREEIRNRLWPDDTIVEFEKSFDTVLPRCDEAEKAPRRLEFVILPLTRSAQLGSLAGRIASE